jgi:hypothetical protein
MGLEKKIYIEKKNIWKQFYYYQQDNKKQNYKHSNNDQCNDTTRRNDTHI